MSLTPNTSTVTLGGTITLNWSTTGSTGCAAQGGWTGTKATSGSEVVTPAENPTVFTLHCTGAGGSTDGSISVAVKAVQTTATATTSNPTVSLGTELTVNLSSDTTLLNAGVTLEKFSDAAVNQAARDDAPVLETDLSSTTTYRISLPSVPKKPFEVTLHTGTKYTNASSSATAPAIYYQAPPNDDDDAEFSPVDTTLEQNGDLHGLLPPEAFSPATSGGVTAILKIGEAKTSNTRVSPTGSVAAPRIMSVHDDMEVAAETAPKALISCPMDGDCVERSMYNPGRDITSGQSGGHRGMDLVAPEGTSIKTPIEAKVVEGTTSIGSCGKYVVVEVASIPAKLKYCHLSAIDKTLLTKDEKDVFKTAVATAGKIGLSGHTSTKTVPSHLHFGMYTAASKACKKVSGNEVCQYVYTTVDPFPYLINSFHIKPLTDTVLKKDGVYDIDIEAKDPAGALVKSDVGNPTAKDPTRKICVASDNAVTISYTVDTGVTLEAGPTAKEGATMCAPWGKKIHIKSTSDRPTTTVTARYSVRPNLALTSDPLSEHSDQIVLGGKDAATKIEEFIEWSIDGTKVAHVKPDRMILNRVNSEPLYLDLDAYKDATDEVEDVSIYVEGVAVNSATPIKANMTDCLDPDAVRSEAWVTVPNSLWDQNLAKGGLPATPYVMLSCDYVRKYSTPAGNVTVNLKQVQLDDDPATLLYTETGTQVAYGTFSYSVSDQEAAVLGKFAIGDKKVEGTFQFKLGTCSKEYGCPVK